MPHACMDVDCSSFLECPTSNSAYLPALSNDIFCTEPLVKDGKKAEVLEITHTISIKLCVMILAHASGL